MFEPCNLSHQPRANNTVILLKHLYNYWVTVHMKQLYPVACT